MTSKMIRRMIVAGTAFCGCGDPPSQVTDDGGTETETETEGNSTTGSPMVTTNDDATSVASGSADDTGPAQTTGDPATDGEVTDDGTTEDATTGEATDGGTTGETTTGEATSEEGSSGGSTSGGPDCAALDNIVECNLTMGCTWVGTPVSGDCQEA
jgi:hypothetical protein